MSEAKDAVSGNEAQGVELKACPKGHDAVEVLSGGYEDRIQYCVGCRECLWEGPDASSEQLAIALWNDRPAHSYPPHVAALLAAAKKWVVASEDRDMLLSQHERFESPNAIITTEREALNALKDAARAFEESA